MKKGNTEEPRWTEHLRRSPTDMGRDLGGQPEGWGHRLG
jgi:hypothetical protein